MPKNRLILDVAKTWDGRPIAFDERVMLTLEATDAGLRVCIDAPFYGDPPPPGPPGSTDRLWEFEVVELFLAGCTETDGDHVPYIEIELSPHGHHLVLRLEGVRRVVETGLELNYEAEIEGDTWQGIAIVPWAYLPAGALSANAYALCGAGRKRRYLAMVPVPGSRPDFHQPAVFQRLPIGRRSPSRRGGAVDP
ncbi:MAG: hypothetical protein HC897_03275 [Thermoanaerobaculia bacterium]|nr:hypothetical protein [Thermoanaerobaculia bacterium]